MQYNFKKTNETIEQIIDRVQKDSRIKNSQAVQRFLGETSKHQISEPPCTISEQQEVQIPSVRS